MPHLISNLYEKSYTPFVAKLAPRHLWSKPALGNNALTKTVLNGNTDRKEAPEGFKIWQRPHSESNLEIYS